MTNIGTLPLQVTLRSHSRRPNLRHVARDRTEIAPRSHRDRTEIATKSHEIAWIARGRYPMATPGSRLEAHIGPVQSQIGVGPVPSDARTGCTGAAAQDRREITRRRIQVAQIAVRSP